MVTNVETRFRIRKKGEYYALDKMQDGKVIKSWTLNPDKLGKMFECPTKEADKVSKIVGQSSDLKDQKGVYYLLNELPKDDTSVSIKDIQAAQNKIMDEILGKSK